VEWRGRPDAAASRLRYEFDGRFSMIIGSPFAGRKVTRNVGHTACPGFSRKLKRLTIAASTSVASCKAKVDPMHLRGPAPNGR
jgi:hypothetical protein